MSRRKRRSVQESLLIKLGSIAVHADELIETRASGATFDVAALQTVLDSEVRTWIKSMGPLLPLKRSTTSV